jgi:6-phosphogluconolactonase
MSATSKTTPYVFVGTYTEFEGSQSEGVYVYRMDASSGKLALDKVVKGVINSSFLEIHPDRQYLYVVDEVQTYGGQTGVVPAHSPSTRRRSIY